MTQEQPPILSYSEQLMLIRNGLAPKTTLKKPKKYLRKVSEKKSEEIKKEKEARNGDEDTDMERWFKARRKELVGICQCGCARKSSKLDDLNFRSSCCHIFPKAKFESVKYHRLNCVERNFWDGCHGNMDNRSMDLWPNFADFDDIKEKFHTLAPLLTDQERATKFYHNLEKIVYKNP